MAAPKLDSLDPTSIVCSCMPVVVYNGVFFCLNQGFYQIEFETDCVIRTYMPQPTVFYICQCTRLKVRTGNLKDNKFQVTVAGSSPVTFHQFTHHLFQCFTCFPESNSLEQLELLTRAGGVGRFSFICLLSTNQSSQTSLPGQYLLLNFDGTLPFGPGRFVDVVCGSEWQSDNQKLWCTVLSLCVLTMPALAFQFPHKMASPRGRHHSAPYPQPLHIPGSDVINNCCGVFVQLHDEIAGRPPLPFGGQSCII